MISKKKKKKKNDSVRSGDAFEDTALKPGFKNFKF